MLWVDERRRPRRQRAVRVAVTLAVLVEALPLAGPGSAWALCPNCLGQTRSVTPTLELIGLFLLLPFLVAFAVLRRIRRLSSPGRAAPPPFHQQGGK